MARLKKLLKKAENKEAEKEIVQEGISQVESKLGVNLGDTETLVDMAKTVPQAITMNWADELLELVGKPEWGQATKDWAQEARERSPKATFATELALPPGVGGGKSVLKAAALGGLSGAGMGEDKVERLIYGAGGSGLGAAGTFAGNMLNKLIGNPKATRAVSVGAPQRALKIKSGPKSIEEAVETVQKLGFLNKGNRKFNPATKEWSRGKGIKVEEGENFLTGLQDRAIDAEKAIDTEVRNILSKNKLKVFGQEVEEYVPLLEDLDALERKLSASIGDEKAYKLVQEELNKLKNFIDEPAVQFDMDGSPIFGEGPKRGKSFLELDKDVKAIWQSMSDDVLQAESKGGVLAPDQKARGQVQRAIAINLRKFIIDKMGGAEGQKIADLNNISSSLKTIRQVALEEGIASQQSAGFKMNAPIGTNAAYFGSKLAEGLGATPEAGISRAGMSESFRKIPTPLRKFGEQAMKKYPLEEGQRLMQSAEGSPALMGIDALLSSPDRSPDSIQDPAAKINPMVQDQLIPRSTEWIKAHPNLTKAKLLQTAPELAAQVSIALERGDDRMLEQILPMVSMQVPHIFENDEYDSFDGKIFNPQQKARYTEKLMMDENLDSYEKAEIIDHLNKTNEVLK